MSLLKSLLLFQKGRQEKLLSPKCQMPREGVTALSKPLLLSSLPVALQAPSMPFSL